MWKIETESADLFDINVIITTNNKLVNTLHYYE